jgi:starch synthase
MASGLKILYASAEVVPFAKTGGLADVAGALPKVLAQMGHDVRIVMPRYSSIDGAKYGLRPVLPPFRIPHGNDYIEISIEQSDAIPGVTTYFIRNDYLYDRPGLYGQPDDDHRFVAYCRGIMELIHQLGWAPDVINCNDWHTGLVPVYLKTLYAGRAGYENIASLYTIHNLAYQGNFPPETMELAGLPWDLFTWDKLEFWGNFNFMKAGLIYADTLSTVSETYAKEVQTPEYGERLDGVMAYRSDDLYGIINGVDYHEWNPRDDGFIPAHFSPENLDGKRACKRALQKEMGLPEEAGTPLFGVVSRLSSQKGFDLLEEALPQLLTTQHMQVVILGTGDQHYHDMLTRLQEQHKDKLAVALKFDNALAHRIYAGSDMFLMPSRYEPCGLGQLISLAYGTIPVARATGGIADTVSEFKSLRSRGNGFTFTEYDAEELTDTITCALKCYADPRVECWCRVVANAFASDCSWQASAKKYLRVYKLAMKSIARLAA